MKKELTLKEVSEFRPTRESASGITEEVKEFACNNMCKFNKECSEMLEDARFDEFIELECPLNYL